MYHRQIFKQFLCNKVLKNPRQRRFFKSNDLYELFTLKETSEEGSTETGAIFAGTGSEVQLDPTKTYKHCKITPKLSAEAPPITFSRKKAEKKKMNEQKLKVKSEEIDNTCDNKVSFSNEKIERMKKLAQMLSQKIVKNMSPDKTDSTIEVMPGRSKCEETDMISNHETSINETDFSSLSTTSKRNYLHPLTHHGQESQENINKCDTTGNDCGSTTVFGSSNNASGCSERSTRKTHKSTHNKKKKKKHKDANFEGETVPHLVRAGKSTSVPEKGNEHGTEKYATQDEYVLQKLFARSGLQTALKHDTIMEGGPADYLLVEGEADRVAQQAIEKLQESRRECWQASSGVPNFTGLNGARNFRLEKVLNRKKPTLADLSALDLLERIRERNCSRLVRDPEITLVQDIRDFVSSQGGTVHTTKLIERFKGRLPEGSSPIFKSLLGKICTFYRAPDKLGYWNLKEEFNW